MGKPINNSINIELSFESCKFYIVSYDWSIIFQWFCYTQVSNYKNLLKEKFCLENKLDISIIIFWKMWKF